MTTQWLELQTSVLPTPQASFLDSLMLASTHRLRMVMKRVALMMMMMMTTQIGDNDDEYAKKMEEYHFRWFQSLVEFLSSSRLPLLESSNLSNPSLPLRKESETLSPSSSLQTCPYRSQCSWHIQSTTSPPGPLSTHRASLCIGSFSSSPSSTSWAPRPASRLSLTAGISTPCWWQLTPPLWWRGYERQIWWEGEKE